MYFGQIWTWFSSSYMETTKHGTGHQTGPSPQGACLRTSGQAFAWGRCECRGVLVGEMDGDGE